MPTSSIQLKDQLALRIENEVRQQMDDILERIHQIAITHNIADKDKDKKSPFRNLLAVAVEPSSSLAVITNYIRYQVGRSGSSSIWSPKEGGALFAKELVEALLGLSDDVDLIFKHVESSLGRRDEELSEGDKPLEVGHPSPNPSPDQERLLAHIDENRDRLRRSLHLELAQLYLGYLAREHTAQVGEQSAPKNSDKNDGDRTTKGNSPQSKGQSNQLRKPNRR